jgi:tetratricopeptide (TPR) repeat protein
LRFRSSPPAPIETVEPASPPVQELLAKAEASLKFRQTEQALLLFRQAEALDSSRVEPHLGVARAELSAGRETEAAREYERVLKLDRNNSAALLQLATIHSHRPNSWAIAETELTRYVQLQLKDAAAQLRLARLLVWQKKWKQAAEIYSRPAVLSLSTEQDRKQYIYALINSSQWDRAEAALKQMVTAGNQDFELRLQLANLYATRHDWDSALPLYQSLLGLRPDNPEVNRTYGMGLLATHQYQSALTPLSRAVAAVPGDAEAGLAYARALRGAGEYKQADRQFERIMLQFESDASVHREYADFLLEKKDYRKAQKEYEAAYYLGLRDIRLLVSLSGTLRAQNKPKKALPLLEEAYKLKPTDRLAFELAEVLHQVGQDARASDLISKLERRATKSAP